MGTITNIIYYDITRIVQKINNNTPTGIDRVDIRYANSLLQLESIINVIYVIQSGKTLIQLPLSLSKIIINEKTNEWVCFNKNGPNKNREDISKKIENYLKYPNKNLQKSANALYVNISHCGLDNLSIFNYAHNELNAKSLIYIHDLIPITHPEFTLEGDREKHIKRIKNALTYGSALITNSETTKLAITKFSDEINKKLDIYVIEIGLEEIFVNNADTWNSCNTENYFITVGTIEPRKNYQFLIEVWKEILEKNSELELYIVGKFGWNHNLVKCYLNNNPKIKEKVHHLTNVKDIELVELYKKSKGFLYPTLVEGWGIPLKEALTIGLPCIVSDIDVLRECARNNSIFLSPINGQDWVQKILGTLNLETSTRKQYASYSTWNDSCQLFIKLCRNVLSVGKPYIPELAYYSKINLIKFEAKKNNKYDARKLFLKFKKSPIVYMEDSKHSFLRFMGRILRRINELHFKKNRIH